MPAWGGDASVTVPRYGLVAGLAAGLALSCDAAPEQEDLDEPRWAQDPIEVRVVTANLAQWNWDALLARNGLESDDYILFGALQLWYLQTLEAPGATIYNIQESSVRREESGGFNWPMALELALGSEAVLPQHATYASTYERFSPLQDHDVGTWGSALTTNLDVEDYEVWNLSEGCGPGVRRVAQAARFDVGLVSLWSVNVHFEICDYAEVNACNLDNLLDQLDDLPTDDVVIVSGDFNIAQDATDDCPHHPAHFQDMVDGFRDRQFVRVDSVKVDHIFVRDPQFKLSGVESRTFDPLVDTSNGPVDVSDHHFIETDFDVLGPGMSPSLVPLLTTL